MTQHRQPLTIICGNAATGKTTLGKKRSQEQGAVLLDIDTVSERLVQAGLLELGLDPADRDSERYKRIYREAIHETLFALAEENLDHLPCIITAPFTQERRDRAFVQHLERRLRTKVSVVYLTCSDETRLKRMKQRNNPRDSAKFAAWDAYAKAGNDLSPPPFEHETINNDDLPEGS
jgi:predicted kinase